MSTTHVNDMSNIETCYFVFFVLFCFLNMLECMATVGIRWLKIVLFVKHQKGYEDYKMSREPTFTKR